MSKNRKHREASVGAALPKPTAGNKMISPASDSRDSSPGWFSRRVALQLLGLAGLSCVLGFTFNAASPVGVRFGEPAATTVAAKVTATPPNLPPTPAPSISVPAPALPPPPAPATTPAPQPAALPPTPVVASPTVPTRHVHPVASPVITPATPSAVVTNPTPIHWPEAKVLAAEGRAVLVDVRHKSMYDAGHIPGAISLPEMSPPADFTTFLSQQPTNLAVIVYCSSTSCSQSLRVANRLVMEFQWPAVRYMTGGYLEYQQAELAKPAPTPTP